MQPYDCVLRPAWHILQAKNPRSTHFFRGCENPLRYLKAQIEFGYLLLIPDNPGRVAHVVFMVLCLVNNIFACANMLLGAAAVITAVYVLMRFF